MQGQSMENPNSSNAIVAAIAILHQEEASLATQITKLQTRLNSVHSAIASMSTLVEDVHIAKEVVPLLTKLTEVQRTSTGYEGLPFSKALSKFMENAQNPMGASEIATLMKTAGYIFGSKNESTQVFVALKRNEGKLYLKTQDGKKWVAIKSSQAFL
jgi:hypothetical protein